MLLLLLLLCLPAAENWVPGFVAAECGRLLEVV
jgi:hypothetical protein